MENIIQSLHEMEVHSTKVIFDDVTVLRVANGWVYILGHSKTSTFVPEPPVTEVNFEPVPFHIATPEDYAEGAREREEEAKQERIKAEKAYQEEKAKHLQAEREKLADKTKDEFYLFIGAMVLMAVFAFATYISYRQGYAAGKLENSKELSAIIDRQRAHIEKQEKVFDEYTRAYDEQAKMFIEHLAQDH